MICQQPTHHPTNKPKAPSPGLPSLVWQHRLVVSACILGSIAIAKLYLAVARPVYTSTASIYVQPDGPRIMNEDRSAAMTASNNYLYNQIELIRSRPVVAKAVEACLAADLRSMRDINEPIEIVLRNLEVSLGRKDDIIRISFWGPDPRENAFIANAIVKSYLAFIAQQRAKTFGQVLNILETQKAARQVACSQAQEILTDLANKYPQLAFSPETGRALLDQLKDIWSAFTEASLAELEARSLLEAAKKAKDDPEAFLMTIGSKIPSGQRGDAEAETARLKASLKQLESSRSDRLRLVTVEHPSIKAIDAQIAQTRQDLASLQQRLVSTGLYILEQQHLSAQQKVKELASRLDQQSRQISLFDKAFALYTQAQTQYQQEKRLCELLDQRIREVRMAADAGALNITVIEDAQPATRPSRPRPAKVVAIALVLGLATGCGLAVLIEATSKRIRDARLIRELVPYPVIGQVPVITKRRSDQATEAFRMIRAAILTGPPEKHAHIIQVASSLPAEGASTTATYLAMAMARTEQRVLLVDANLRNPSLHKIFGLDGRIGLSAVLTRKSRLSSAVVPTAMRRLHLLPAGSDQTSSRELLFGKAFGQLISVLARYYERIIIDSPPFVDAADAQVITAVSQAVILVVRPGICTYHALGLTEDLLARHPDRQVGLVINAVPMTTLASKAVYGNHNGRYRGHILASLGIWSGVPIALELTGYKRVTN